MNATETVKACWTAMEQGDMQKVSGYLSDDFKLSGPVPQPMGKQEFIKLMGAIVTGVPNWKFNTSHIHQEGNTVELTHRITGTHSREMPGLMPGMRAAPATGKTIKLPEEHLVVTFRGDKISKIQVDAVPNGGVPGMLQQLGIALPAGQTK